MMMPTHRAIPTTDKDFVFLNLAKDMEACKWTGSFKDMEAWFTSGCTKIYMLNAQSKLASWEPQGELYVYYRICEHL